MINGVSSALSGSPLINLIPALRTELELIPVSDSLVYLIDTVPEEALYTLAVQFNVLGWAGWNLASTEADKRALIKRAYLIHRYKGTIFGIDLALRALGFSDITIREGLGVEHDGTHVRDGSITYAGGNWATFRVSLGVPDDFAISPEVTQEVINVIEAHKNARSHLLDVTFRTTFSDSLGLSETLELDDGNLTDRLSGGIRRDGSSNYDGTEQHNGISETGRFTIFVNGQISETYEF